MTSPVRAAPGAELQPELRPELPPLPQRMRRLLIDGRGYPVPWFVAVVDGTPDHRIVDRAKLERAVRDHRCFLCGHGLGAYKAFVIGPMCAVNRISSEPPSHRSCAEYAAVACPFLSRPHAHRRDAGMPEGLQNPAGVMLPRNPGVTLLWITKRYTLQRVPNGVLFEIGEPVELRCYVGGRPATRAEIEHSLTTGLPALEAIARKDGPRAVRALERQTVQARALLGVA